MSPQFQLMLQQAIQAFQDQNYNTAESILKRIIQIDAKNLPALHILGLIKASQENYREAVNFLSRAARIHPNDASIQYNLAKALSDCGLEKESIPHHKKSVELSPNNPVAWLNYGKTTTNLNRHDEALTYYGKALDLNPNFSKAALNIGATLKELKRYDEAIAFAEQAILIDPHLAEGWVNKGIALKELKHYEEAIAHYDKALSLKPDIDWVHGDLLHAKMKICDWSNLADSLGNISKKVMANESISPPFPLLALSDNPSLHKKSSEIYIQKKYPINLSLGQAPRRPKNEKIRIGYFSADFRNHPVSFLTAELFELHDKNKFEITAFSFGIEDKSPMRLRLSKAFNQFIDVSKMSDLEIAKLTRDLQIDIAVDLGGHTANSRTNIFAYQAAPIQVGYIGYLGTMGAEYYNYLLADRTIIPDDLQHFYSEKIAYLPSYQANDRKRIISPKQLTRADLELPEVGFVFCCFNNNYKILPSTFDSWMRILNAVEGSVLFLYADNERSKANLINEASLRGIDSARLVFGRRIPMEEYLARYQSCSLFLDTFPYNAGTTASDALWAGLPVLTLIGQSFASRMAASLLRAIDLPELIANTQEEYEALAIELAQNPQKLTTIKLKLANNRLTTPLFNTPLFSENLEAAYIKMYERHLGSLPTEHLHIQPHPSH